MTRLASHSNSTHQFKWISSVPEKSRSHIFEYAVDNHSSSRFLHCTANSNPNWQCNGTTALVNKAHPPLAKLPHSPHPGKIQGTFLNQDWTSQLHCAVPKDDSLDTKPNLDNSWDAKGYTGAHHQTAWQSSLNRQNAQRQYFRAYQICN